MITVIAACAVRLVINWKESNNMEQGTLDVTFEIENSDHAAVFTFKEPIVPDSYIRKVTYQEGKLQNIEYRDKENEKIVYYNQTAVSESMSLSLDNEEDSFSQISINGHKGYSVDEPEYSAITWSDGVSMYTIMSNSPFWEIVAMAESVQ